MYEEYSEGTCLAEDQILYLIPYNDPWMWMNDDAVALADELVDVIFDHYGLSDGFPIVSTGGSMGGLAALTYMAYAKRTPVAAVANCPVCDLVSHFSERPDLPRTIYAAYRRSPGTLEEALAAGSPLHLAKAGRLPRASYAVFHCGGDQAVSKTLHSDRFIPALRKALPDCTVIYHEIPGRSHGDLGEEMGAVYLDTIRRFALGL